MGRTAAMVVCLTGLAIVVSAALAGAAATAGADSFTPVNLAITIAPTARLAKPLAISVTVTADAGALDSSTAPLRIRARLAGGAAGRSTRRPAPC